MEKENNKIVMTEIDLLININLNKIYENESKQEYYNHFIDKDGNSINENHNGETIAYEMRNNGLIRLNGENCHLLKFGEEVCKNGGWLKYLELHKLEKLNYSKIEKERQEIKDKIDSLTLKNLQYEEKIRNQNDRIRDLDEQLKVISLLKKYWLLILGFISFGVFLSKVLV